MRLLVSHQPPASHICQPHAHSLFYYLHVVAKMVLLCVTVADTNSRKALLPWEVIESHSKTDTIREFFNLVYLSHYWITIFSYTFGSSLQDIELSEPFKKVYLRNISCYEPIEKLYYSAGYDPICIYCAEKVTVQDANAEFFLQCT